VRTRTSGPARSEVFLGDFPTSTGMGATVGGPKKRGLRMPAVDVLGATNTASKNVKDIERSLKRF
jgi:hypothetical protein